MQPTIHLSLHDRFGYRVAIVARRWRQQIDSELESYGLSQATWRPLIHLASFKDAPRQCELAEALQIGGPALVRLLDNLEHKGLVDRIDVDGDRRANHVQLTREGRKLATRVYEIIVTFEKRLLEGMSAADIARCARILDTIEDRLSTPQPASREVRRRA
jgi:MarR family transcriptional regulator, transcriptional regulator for hemolysin